MGHDITAYRSEQSYTELNAELSYLRYNAFNNAARGIYQALGAEDCDCGCSGCGEGRTFTKAQLLAAVKSLPPDDHQQASVTFLWDCINKGGESVYITFS